MLGAVAALAALAALRVMVGGSFAWHACRVVFNRRPPLRVSDAQPEPWIVVVAHNP